MFIYILEHPADAEPFFRKPIPENLPAGLLKTGSIRQEEKTENGWVSKKYTLECMADSAGTYVLPETEVWVQGLKLTTRPPRATVTSHFKNPGAGPKKLFGWRLPEQQKNGRISGAVIAGVIFALFCVALLFAARGLLRFSKSKNKKNEQADPLCLEIDSLSSLLRKGEITTVETFERLSQTFMKFMKKRFFVSPSQLSSPENIRKVLSKKAVGNDEIILMEQFHKKLRSIRFAGAKPSHSECLEAVSVIRDFISEHTAKTLAETAESLKAS